MSVTVLKEMLKDIDVLPMWTEIITITSKPMTEDRVVIGDNPSSLAYQDHFIQVELGPKNVLAEEIHEHLEKYMNPDDLDMPLNDLAGTIIVLNDYQMDETLGGFKIDADGNVNPIDWQKVEDEVQETLGVLLDDLIGFIRVATTR